jgi:hypothetical protein
VPATGQNSYILLGGDVILWIERGTVMLKASDLNGRPVELSTDDATTLSQLLLDLATRKPEST